MGGQSAAFMDQILLSLQNGIQIYRWCYLNAFPVWNLSWRTCHTWAWRSYSLERPRQEEDEVAATEGENCNGRREREINPRILQLALNNETDSARVCVTDQRIALV